MRGKVLVVDDEKSVRDLLDSFLTATGYQAILASNGEEAIELARSESPNAIILDFKMPGIDGVETCRRLRKEKQTRLAGNTNVYTCPKYNSDNLLSSFELVFSC